MCVCRLWRANLGATAGGGEGVARRKKQHTTMPPLSPVRSPTQTPPHTQVIATSLHRSVSTSTDAPTFASAFRFDTLVGASPRAQVWRATHTSTGRVYAVKRSGHTLTSRAVRDRWAREVGAVAAVPPHPHLVRAHRAWQEARHAFILMDFCAGLTLADAAAAAPGGRLPPPAAWRVASHVSSALAALHAARVAHLDVKPDNVYIDDDGDTGRAVLKVREREGVW